LDFKKHIIVVAGGSGSRMKSEIPKQFLVLSDGMPILMHTIAKFFYTYPDIKIILVLPANEISFWKKLVLEHHFEIEHKIVEGGVTRFHSVKNGLDTIDENLKNCVVGIHDGVRPLVNAETITNCFHTAFDLGNAIPSIGLKDSIRKKNISSNVYEAQDRNLYQLIQTPQCFQLGILKKAYQTEFKEIFTDDASVVEYLGEKINLVAGNEENIKITTPTDLLIANSFLQKNRGY
jgi:2-C-methyl-D-erythritol 4-phosphate cytidylyltransferase